MSESIPTSQINKIERDVYVSLKEYFEARLTSLDERTKQTADDSKIALEKAEKALERRLDLLNEFRSQAADEAKKYLPINVYDEKHSALTERLSKYEMQISRLYGGIIAIGVIGIANLVKLWFAH